MGKKASAYRTHPRNEGRPQKTPDVADAEFKKEGNSNACDLGRQWDGFKKGKTGRSSIIPKTKRDSAGSHWDFKDIIRIKEQGGEGNPDAKKGKNWNVSQ